jgi:hypothetical protein
MTDGGFKIRDISYTIEDGWLNCVRAALAYAADVLAQEDAYPLVVYT